MSVVSRICGATVAAKGCPSFPVFHSMLDVCARSSCDPRHRAGAGAFNLTCDGNPSVLAQVVDVGSSFHDAHFRVLLFSRLCGD